MAKKKEAEAPPSYMERTRAAIINQCEVRGIPEEEAGSVIAAIEKRFETSLGEMDEGRLRRVNEQLEAVLLEYLDGKKRR